MCVCVCVCVCESQKQREKQLRALQKEIIPLWVKRYSLAHGVLGSCRVLTIWSRSKHVKGEKEHYLLQQNTTCKFSA